LDLFDGGNHLFWHALFGELISGRIKIGILGKSLVLDLTVVNIQGITLAAADQSLADRAGVGHDHVKVLGEVSVRVGVKGDVGVNDLLVLGPSLHDGWVVDAVDHDFLDTDGLQFVFGREVSRNLTCGSGRGESTRQSNNDYLLALGVFKNIDLLGFKVREELELWSELFQRHFGCSIL